VRRLAVRDLEHDLADPAPQVAHGCRRVRKREAASDQRWFHAQRVERIGSLRTPLFDLIDTRNLAPDQLDRNGSGGVSLTVLGDSSNVCHWCLTPAIKSTNRVESLSPSRNGSSDTSSG
jgi:hypothetical protein